MDPHDDPELRRVLKHHAEYFTAPADLRSRVQASIRQSGNDRPPRHTRLGEQLRSWLTLPLTRMSAAFVAGACVAILATTLLHRPATGDATLLALVSDHTRAQLTDSTIEVTSRSEHTVKPWLSAKLGYSPNVVDLADVGFPLAGGRRGYVGSVPVAVMVYSFRRA